MIVNEISLEIQNIISLTKICLYDVDNCRFLHGIHSELHELIHHLIRAQATEK